MTARVTPSDLRAITDAEGAATIGGPLLREVADAWSYALMDCERKRQALLAEVDKSARFLRDLHDSLLTAERQARRIAELEEGSADEDELRFRMAGLLTGTANALKGAPKPTYSHDWSDLPKVATALQADLLLAMFTIDRALYWLHKGCHRIAFDVLSEYRAAEPKEGA